MNKGDSGGICWDRAADVELKSLLRVGEALDDMDALAVMLRGRRDARGSKEAIVGGSDVPLEALYRLRRQLWYYTVKSWKLARFIGLDTNCLLLPG